MAHEIDGLQQFNDWFATLSDSTIDTMIAPINEMLNGDPLPLYPKRGIVPQRLNPERKYHEQDHVMV